jgi:hypothetical protein
VKIKKLEFEIEFLSKSNQKSKDLINSLENDMKNYLMQIANLKVDASLKDE